ncbi:hypothetical protein GWK47_045042 [Chionoecetes opilio]|uniref:Uncharacterized protein n=1 Tax=Chionoecetes opilio TaxID=41210 RepID=A0A8J4Y7K5_CHIOP|nr:hypothetical protein GWK47_045042 [Chionoecetes opilio]
MTSWLSAHVRAMKKLSRSDRDSSLWRLPMLTTAPCPTPTPERRLRTTVASQVCCREDPGLFFISLRGRTPGYAGGSGILGDDTLAIKNSINILGIWRLTPGFRFDRHLETVARRASFGGLFPCADLRHLLDADGLMRLYKGPQVRPSWSTVLYRMSSAQCTCPAGQSAEAC